MDNRFDINLGESEVKNLKTSYGRRGHVAELLARFEYGLKRPEEIVKNFEYRPYTLETIDAETLKYFDNDIEKANDFFYKYYKNRIEVIPKKHRKFIQKYAHPSTLDFGYAWIGKPIDFARIEFDEEKQSRPISIFEVKSKSHDSKTRKFEITSNTAEAFKEAKKAGIKTYLIVVYFIDNWDYKFELRECDVSDFKIGNRW